MQRSFKALLYGASRSQPYRTCATVVQNTMASAKQLADIKSSKGKTDYGWIYYLENPVTYKTHIMEPRDYVTDNSTAGEFDRLILPNIDRIMKQKKTLDSKLRYMDIGCCFGNTTLALVHGMTTDDIREAWKDEKSCQQIAAKRRLALEATGVDISESALRYGKSVGIFDQTITADLNKDEDLANVVAAAPSQDIVIIAGAIMYFKPESVNALCEAFASGGGEGYFVVNFLNLFEQAKADVLKGIFLKHLDFVGSTASRHRLLSDEEKAEYPNAGDWVLLEVWVLKRPEKSDRCSRGN